MAHRSIQKGAPREPAGPPNTERCLVPPTSPLFAQIEDDEEVSRKFGSSCNVKAVVDTGDHESALMRPRNLLGSDHCDVYAVSPVFSSERTRNGL